MKINKGEAQITAGKVENFLKINKRVYPSIWDLRVCIAFLCRYGLNSHTWWHLWKNLGSRLSKLVKVPSPDQGKMKNFSFDFILPENNNVIIFLSERRHYVTFHLLGIFRYHWSLIFTFLFTFLFTWKGAGDVKCWNLKLKFGYEIEFESNLQVFF